MERRKEIFLYVGAPKCGSTFLFTCSKKENIVAGLRQQGFSFIDTFEMIIYDMQERESVARPDTNILDFKFEKKIFGDDVLKGYLQGVITQIDKSDCLRHIIIQENFSLFAMIAPEFFERIIEQVLKPLKSRYIVNVIFFIRPQSALIESLYTQHVRFGLRKDIDQYFSGLAIERFSWAMQRDLFSQVSSDGQIKIVPFLPKVINKQLGKNFVELFFESCGLLTKISNEQIGQIYNPSCMPELLDLMVYANKTLPKMLAHDVNLHLSQKFPRPFENRQSILNQVHLDKLTKLFNEENKRLISDNAPWCPEGAFSI